MIPTNSTKIYRLSVPDQVNSFQIPSDTRKVLLKNAGANAVRFNFDGSGTHYFTIDPGQSLPVMFSIIPGGTIYTDGVGGSTILESICE